MMSSILSVMSMVQAWVEQARARRLSTRSVATKSMSDCSLG